MVIRTRSRVRASLERQAQEAQADFYHPDTAPQASSNFIPGSFDPSDYSEDPGSPLDPLTPTESTGHSSKSDFPELDEENSLFNEAFPTPPTLTSGSSSPRNTNSGNSHQQQGATRPLNPFNSNTFVNPNTTPPSFQITVPIIRNPTSSNQPTITQKTSKMPKDLINPLDKYAPKFDGKEPEELDRFWHLMDKAMIAAGITAANDKMEKIVEYVDRKTAREWTQLDSYQGGDFDKFKEEVFAGYPEAEDYAKGSVERLEKICFQHRELEARDFVRIHEFRRAFMAEYKMLGGAGSTSITNRELVSLLLRSLSAKLASTLKSHLLLKLGLTNTTAGNARNPKDPYAVTEVFDKLLELVNLERGPMGGSVVPSVDEVVSTSMNRPGIVNIKKEPEDFKATLRETLDAYMKEERKQREAFETSLKREISQMIASRAPAKSEAPSTRPMQNRGLPPGAPSNSCYFCWEQGHIQPECEHFRAFLERGWIEPHPSGRGYKLPGNDMLPRENYTSTAPRFRIEAWYAQRKNAHGVNVHQQLYYNDWEAEQEGVIAMGPPPSTWYNPVGERYVPAGGVKPRVWSQHGSSTRVSSLAQ